MFKDKKEYHEQLKAKTHEEYSRKDRKQKKTQCELLKNSEEKVEQHKKMTKKKSRNKI